MNKAIAEVRLQFELLEVEFNQLATDEDNQGSAPH